MQGQQAATYHVSQVPSHTAPGAHDFLCLQLLWPHVNDNIPAEGTGSTNSLSLPYTLRPTNERTHAPVLTLRKISLYFVRVIICFTSFRPVTMSLTSWPASGIAK